MGPYSLVLISPSVSPSIFLSFNSLSHIQTSPSLPISGTLINSLFLTMFKKSFVDLFASASAFYTRIKLWIFIFMYLFIITLYLFFFVFSIWSLLDYSIQFHRFQVLVIHNPIFLMYFVIFHFLTKKISFFRIWWFYFILLKKEKRTREF